MITVAYKYKQIVWASFLIWVALVLLISLSSKWSVSSQLLFITLFSLIGVLTLLLQRWRIVAHTSTKQIVIRTISKTHRFLLQDIHELSLPRQSETKLADDETLYQICSIKYERDSQKTAVEIPYRVFDQTAMAAFLKWIYDNRPDLGSYDDAIWKQRIF